MALAGTATATGAWAQSANESTNRIAVKSDWSVFAENNPKECWGVSSPKSSLNTKGGRKVNVNRGDILLFVTFRPNGSADGEISFTGGYPFDSKAGGTMSVDGHTYNLFTEGQWAWPKTPADASGLMAALKKGSEAKITAHSTRGTQTVDTFSLMGFTAAMDAAKARCNGK
nr:invasion associated locus B family protein [Solirhodobacter olei]